MSKGVSIPWRQIASKLFQMVNQARLASNVDLPAGLGAESFSIRNLDRPFAAEAFFLAENPLPLMGDGFRAEDISAWSFDTVLPAETFMPIEYPVHTAKTGAWEEKAKEMPSPVALPERKISALPAAGSRAVVASPEENRGEPESLDGLLSYLKSQGLKVKEVKTLSEGATRITLDDYLGRRKAREPEFVRVR